jgi:hypothetical protein
MKILTLRFVKLFLILCAISLARNVSAQIPTSPLVWLRADSSVVLSSDTVVAWNDVSGHGNNATPLTSANRPHFLPSGNHGLPAISFDGVAQWLACPNIFPIHKDYTLVVVCHDRSFVNGQNIVSGATGHALIVLNDSLPRMFQGGTIATSIVPMMTNSWSILDNGFTTSTKTADMIVNGLASGSGVSPTDNSDNALEIGAFGGDYTFYGEMSEVLVYDRLLSLSERQNLDAYLARKYQIRLINANPPQHGPIVWLEGDRGVTPVVDSVSIWKDISGNRYDALAVTNAARPTYRTNAVNGHAALTFSGTNVLICPNIFPVYSDYTKVVVFRCSNLATTNNLVSGTTNHALLLAGTVFPYLFHTGAFLQGTQMIQLNKWNVLTATFYGSQGRGRMSLNGKFAGSANTSVQNNDSTLEIGGFAGANNFTGDVAEVIVFNRALTPNESDSLQQALAVKYAIPVVRDRPLFPFTRFPSPLQFIPRDANDSAIVPIAGAVSSSGFDSVRVDQYRDGGYWRSQSFKLHYEAGIAAFSLSPTIYARPVEFGFRVYLVHAGIDSLIGARDSIICGDAFLVTGQSNSTPGNAAMTYSNEFCRSFGSQVNLSTYDVADTAWGLASATGPFSGPFHVGEWALDLQRRILGGYSVPTCIITGGVGGTTIEQNMRNESNPLDLNTIYGRTLYRSKTSGLADKYRAQFWYQGESNTILNYDLNFHVIHRDWRADYPSEKKLYLIQIRPGCGSFASHGLLREFERTVGDSLKDIQPVSPDAIQGHDGCHYTVAGYSQFAGQLYRLLSRDIYTTDDTLEVESPNLAYAAYSNKAHSEITLVFRRRDALVWPAPLFNGTDSLRLENNILLDSISGSIKSGRAVGNHIILTLNSPSYSKLITYIPPVDYPNTATIYEGPWITNNRDVAALTFNDVKILDSLPPEAGVQGSEQTISALHISSIATSYGHTTVVLNLTRNSNTEIELIDALGRTLYRGSQLLSFGRSSVDLRTSGLASGAYVCRVSTNGGWDVSKFEIVR